MKNEFKNLHEISLISEDPYFLSLYAGALFNVGKTEKAEKIAGRMVSMQNKETGAVEGAKSSITNSRGESLLLETTSLAVVDWLNTNPSTFATNIESGVGFILKSIKKGGRFGSTQSTVLSLKALVAYTKMYNGLKGVGTFVLYVNDNKVKQVEFDQYDKDSTLLSQLDFSKDVYDEFKLLHPNDCAPGSQLTIKIAIENFQGNFNGDGFALSYLFSADFKNSAFASAKRAPIKFSIDKFPADSKLKVGDQ